MAVPHDVVSDDETALAARVAELEARVRELEHRVRMSETERDELARACDDARAAQRDAEDSLRVREEILAGVTHDLCNPLGTIVMGATALLQTGGSADPKAQRVRSVAERIQRQAERMARQIRDLADFADIQAGRIEIERARHAPRDLVATASELVGPIAQERGVAFESRAAADLPAVDCDAERVVRVLSSLVASAIKQTARGGAIEIGARPGGPNRVVFFVRDSAPALAREELVALSDAAWRAEPSSCRSRGLGFAIARGVVDAHGGELWADSEPGRGNTVYFSVTPPSN
jgi:signal transduction histidine kinase